ncbi:hypothetical protein Tco_1326375 [Tanacetum coccineum]
MAGSEDDIPPPPPPPSQTPTQQTPHIVSTIKLPILKKGEYDIWAMKMKHYLAHTNYPIFGSFYEVQDGVGAMQPDGMVGNQGERVAKTWTRCSSVPRLNKQLKYLYRSNSTPPKEIHRFVLMLSVEQSHSPSMAEP